MLLGVALHELLEYIAPHERKRLLFEVFGLVDSLGRNLLRYLGLRLGGRHDAPHLAERVHIERHVVRLALIVSDGAVDVVVELRELVDVIPDVAHRGVENVRAVLVDLYALDFLGIHIARDVVAAVDDEAAFPLGEGFMGKYGARQASSHY